MKLFLAARSALAALSIAALAPSTAEAATGVSTCLRLKQNCEAHVAFELKARANTRPDQATVPDGYHLSSQRCEDHYASAEKTGFWPAYRGMPELPCER